MSNTVTVINRASNAVWVGIDPWDINTDPPTGKSAGTLGNTQLDSGAQITFTFDGVPPFKVGAATIFKGAPSGRLETPIRCFMITNVFSKAIVTIASWTESEVEKA